MKLLLSRERTQKEIDLVMDHLEKNKPCAWGVGMGNGPNNANYSQYECNYLIPFVNGRCAAIFQVEKVIHKDQINVKEMFPEEAENWGKNDDGIDFRFSVLITAGLLLPQELQFSEVDLEEINKGQRQGLQRRYIGNNPQLIFLKDSDFPMDLIDLENYEKNQMEILQIEIDPEKILNIAIRIVKVRYLEKGKQDEEKFVMEKSGKLFSPQNLDHITADQYWESLSFDNNRHWTNLERHKSQITQDMRKFIATLKILLDESIDLKKRMELLTTSYNISNFKQAYITPILMFVYSQKYGVFNGVTVNGMKITNVLPKLDYKPEELLNYVKINEQLNYISKVHNISFFELDWVWDVILSAKKNVETKGKKKEEDEQLDIPKNLILYGPPGTGKTFQSIKKAIQIMDSKFTDDDANDSEILMKKFNELREKGFIEFITFHPSYSYEEFIEGYKYDEKQAIPIPKDGLLKRIIKKINPPQSDETILEDSPEKKEIKESAQFWKLSLGKSDVEDDIFEYCIEEGVIALGYGEKIDFKDVTNFEQIQTKLKEKGLSFTKAVVQMIKNFVLDMKKDDIVIISKYNTEIRAIGIVSDDNYEMNPNASINYHQFRNIEWIWNNNVNTISSSNIYKKKFSQRSIYSLKLDQINQIALQNVLNPSNDTINSKQKYVLIIDEINRGNIPNIFGELITCIEEDKRLGAEHELQLSLQYSPPTEKFGVPSNLYIIGTMNTADRSIALLDIALRRRFQFEELKPNVDVIKRVLAKKWQISLDDKSDTAKPFINFIEIISSTFKKINDRIAVLIDDDHRLGHSYFLKLEKESREKDLHKLWYKEIIPLIREYFYNDWEKIAAVLDFYNEKAQKGFIKKKSIKGLFTDENAVPIEETYEIKYYNVIDPDLNWNDLNFVFSKILEQTYIMTKAESKEN